MRETNFFQNLLNLYNQINFNDDEKDLAVIDKNITYYLADKSKQFISVNKPNIIDIDIKSAFPTIVNNMFESCEFLDKLNSLTAKKEKNIFIATSLRNSQYLRRINIVCKIIIYGIVRENCNDFLLLELKKDGLLLQCDNENLEKLLLAISGTEYLKNSLTEYVLSKNFIFHTTEYQSYCRCNKTSFFIRNNELKIKGQFKYLPPKLREDLSNYIKGNSVDFFKLKRIYSDLFLKIIRTTFIQDYLKNYYICENEKVINSENKYVNYNYSIVIDPKIYLRNFVHPILASTRL